MTSSDQGKQHDGAGLSFAPPYDASQEIDPAKAPVVETAAPMRREDFEYFRQRMEKKAMLGRVVLFASVLLLLLFNLWLTQRGTEDVVHNVDESRLHQSEFEDSVNAQLNQIESALSTIQLQQRVLMEKAGVVSPKAAPASPEGAPSATD